MSTGVETPVPQAYLTVYQPGSAARVFALHERGVAVGRGEGNGIALADAEVSPRHLLILPQDGAYYVADQGSSSGTWVNNQRAVQPQFLRSGDQIRVGRTTLVYSLNVPNRPAAPPRTTPLFESLRLGHLDERLRTLPAGWSVGLSVAGGALMLLASTLPWIRAPLIGALPTPSSAVVLCLLGGMAAIGLAFADERGVGRQAVGIGAAVGLVVFCLGTAARFRNLIGFDVDVIGFGSGVVAVAIGAVAVFVGGRAAQMASQR